ncbi:hypothetical protein F5Y16DRAFT_394036 [Xylariaceae sp. FL0255]|nr:hypothetical protein F5Y16DRAFT_394036 [Xylariaceae sp. FL0255]
MASKELSPKIIPNPQQSAVVGGNDTFTIVFSISNLMPQNTSALCYNSAISACPQLGSNQKNDMISKYAFDTDYENNWSLHFRDLTDQTYFVNVQNDDEETIAKGVYGIIYVDMTRIPMDIYNPPTRWQVSTRISVTDHPSNNERYMDCEKLAVITVDWRNSRERRIDRVTLDDLISYGTLLPGCEREQWRKGNNAEVEARFRISGKTALRHRADDKFIVVYKVINLKEGSRLISVDSSISASGVNRPNENNERGIHNLLSYEFACENDFKNNWITGHMDLKKKTHFLHIKENRGSPQGANSVEHSAKSKSTNARKTDSDFETPDDEKYSTGSDVVYVLIYVDATKIPLDMSHPPDAYTIMLNTCWEHKEREFTISSKYGVKLDWTTRHPVNRVKYSANDVRCIEALLDEGTIIGPNSRKNQTWKDQLRNLVLRRQKEDPSPSPSESPSEEVELEE